MPNLPDSLLRPVLPAGDLRAACGCGDVRAVTGADGAELSCTSGDFYQIAALSEKGRGWFCVFGPPTSLVPVLDPDRSEASRCERLDHVHRRVLARRGLEGLEDLGDAVVAIRWDEQRAELSVRRDRFGRIPLMTRGADGERIPVAALSTRPALLRAWTPPDRLPPLWEAFLEGRDNERREDFWPGVQRVFPGEERRWRSGRWESIRRPWQLLAAASAKMRHTQSDEPDLSEPLLQRLKSALDRTASEPGRIFAMSGGLDSTTLVALSVERERDVRTASMVSSRHPALDERRRIEALVQHFQTDHRFIDIGAPDLWSPQSADPGWHDLGPQLLWDAPYTRHFFEHLRRAPSADPTTVVFGIGADQLLLSAPILHLEERARAANIAEWTDLVSKTDNLGDRLRVLAAKARLTPYIRQWRGGLIDRRPLLFEGWKWELSMRALERYRRQSGLRFAFPFLDRELWRFALTLSHRQRRWQGRSKGPLRQALVGRTPEHLPQPEHQSVFNELVVEGMVTLFGRSGPWRDVFSDPEMQRFLNAGRSQHVIDWLDGGGDWREVRQMSSARYLSAWAMWLRWAQAHQCV